MSPTLMSGITPSGKLTIGHIFGCIQSWQVLADTHYCYLGVMDLHAITSPQKEALLRNNVYDAIALYIACGFDPEQHCLFVQSGVKQHSQLAWYLSCYTSVGQLMRMTQFKDKSNQQEDASAGLLTYPILMAADILLYQTTCVPVGDDQKQHIELTRDIAQRVNHHIGDVFTLPKPHIREKGSRIMSLQEPTKKMSKSDPNTNSYISLSDDDNTIRKKIKKAVTDSEANVSYDLNRPGISNLIELYQMLTHEKTSEIESRYHGMGYKTFKEDLANHLIEFLTPIRTRYLELQDQHQMLDGIIEAGNKKAQEQAQETIAKIHKKTGLMF